MMPKKKGLPRQLEEDQDLNDPDHQSPEEFAKEFFGDTAVSQSDDHGLPTLDWLKSQYKTKSAVIRYLVNQGYEIKHIAKHLGVKYQHVRNVATSKLKRGPNEDWRPKAERKEHFGD